MDRLLSEAIWQRAGARCEYCQIPQVFDPRPFEFDHIIARKHYGPTSLDNLAIACFPCNNHKGPKLSGVDPETGVVAQLFHPRRQIWSDHFRWNRGWLVGLRPFGNVTIDVLCINQPHRVAHRESLIEEGVFWH